ncbi:MAG: S41 family peptidase [Roseimicrobium sp.]
MKRLILTSLVTCAASLHAENQLLDALPQSAVQSAFQVLRRDYIRREDLSFEELNRAALQGLLQRLEFGAELAQVSGDAAPEEPGVHAEFLAPDTAYIRPETLGSGEGTLFEKALADSVEKNAKHLILDLRAARVGLFEEAAVMLQSFLPMGELMFKMKQLASDDAELFISKRAPLWEGQLVVLVDSETGPAAEALAAGLYARHRALLIGTKTRGATVRYSTIKLSEGANLRYASAEMLLPDGASVFKKGLVAHFVVTSNLEEKRQVFAQSRGKSHRPFVEDRTRQRFDERALVARLDPELDAYVCKSSGKPMPGDEAQLRDVVTQRALDLLHSNAALQQARLNWQVKPEDLAPLPEENIPKALPAKPAKP